MADIDEEAEDDGIAEDRRNIQSVTHVTQSAPPSLCLVPINDKTSQPLGLDLNYSELDLSMLVEWRRHHQTEYAAKGVQTKSQLSS